MIIARSPASSCCNGIGLAPPPRDHWRLSRNEGSSSKFTSEALVDTINSFSALFFFFFLNICQASVNSGQPSTPDHISNGNHVQAVSNALGIVWNFFSLLLLLV